MWKDDNFWTQTFYSAYKNLVPFRELDSFVGNPSEIFQRWVVHRARGHSQRTRPLARDFRDVSPIHHLPDEFSHAGHLLEWQQAQLNHFARANRHLTWIHMAFLFAVSVMPFSTVIFCANA
jgi:hypothetical protein